MADIPAFYDEIKNRFGNIKRARGFYLYTEKTVRLVDMYLEGGCAVLGWRSGNARLMLKNDLNRGFTGTYCSAFPKQLENALKKLYPAYSSFVQITSDEKYSQILKAAGKDHIPLLRPWLDCGEPETAEVLVPFAWKPYRIFAFKNTANIGSDSVPSPLYKAVTRAFYDLIAEIPLRTEQVLSAHDKYTNRFWERKGIWLFPKVAKDDYPGFFSACLDRQLFISPYYEIPSVVPFSATDGDMAKLKTITLK